MNLFQLALRQVVRSAPIYRLWFFSITAAVMVSYWFQAARFEPSIAVLVESRRSLQAGMGVAAALLALVTGVFLAYSAAFFVRGRSRELGLYRLFGTGRVRLALLLTLENLLAGSAALVTGLVLGVLGSKLFLLALARLNGVEGPRDLSVNPEALAWTAGSFAGLLLLAAATASLGVLRGSLSEVFRQAQKTEKASRWDPFLGAFSVVVLGIGYGLAQLATTQTVVALFLVVTGFTVVGVWAFSRGAAGLAVLVLRRNKAFFWKGSRMVALSNVAHRLGSYARVNFVIALVSSAALIALGVGLNVRLNVEQQLASQFPHPATLAYRTLADREAFVRKLANFGMQFLPEAEAVVLSADRRSPLVAPDGSWQPESLFLHSIDTARRLSGNPSLAAPRDGEAVLVERYSGSGKAWLTRYELYLGGDLFAPREYLDVTKGVSLSLLGDADTRQSLVIADDLWQRWAAKYPEALWTVQSGRVDHPELLLGRQQELEYNGDLSTVFRTDTNLREVARAADIYLFAGLFLGLIFLFCAGAVLHFKHLMEAQGDRARFDVLRKLGLDAREERNAALMQVIPVYALPLLLAGVNGAVALATMGRLMDIDIVLPLVVELAGFSAVFAVMAAVTTRAYLKLIR